MSYAISRDDDFKLYYLLKTIIFIKYNDNDCKFQSYKGTNLCYDMLCESVNSDQEEKEEDLLS